MKASPRGSALHARGGDPSGAAIEKHPTVIKSLPEGFQLVRFHSVPVTRLAGARPMRLGHAARADGACRRYSFADRALVVVRSGDPQVDSAWTRPIAEHVEDKIDPQEP